MDTEVQTLAERMRKYVRAVGEPTRAAILLELERSGELTATQIARRLDLSPTNAYHHVRVLLELGVLEPPRIVPGDSYVEKFYRINPELRAIFRLNPYWYENLGRDLGVEERQAVAAGVFMRTSHALRQAAEAILNMDPESADAYIQDQAFTASTIHASRTELKQRVDAIRQAQADVNLSAAEDVSPRTDILMIASLPSFGDLVVEE